MAFDPFTVDPSLMLAQGPQGAPEQSFGDYLEQSLAKAGPILKMDPNTPGAQAGGLGFWTAMGDLGSVLSGKESTMGQVGTLAGNMGRGALAETKRRELLSLLAPKFGQQQQAPQPQPQATTAPQPTAPQPSKLGTVAPAPTNAGPMDAGAGMPQAPTAGGSNFQQAPWQEGLDHLRRGLQGR